MCACMCACTGLVDLNHNLNHDINHLKKIDIDFLKIFGYFYQTIMIILVIFILKKAFYIIKLYKKKICI